MMSALLIPRSYGFVHGRKRKEKEMGKILNRAIAFVQRLLDGEYITNPFLLMYA